MKNENKKIALELSHVSKSFGKVKALDDASLTLYKGEILAILGENGSGKTSLMNVIDGIYFPDHGTMKVNGKDATIHSPHEAYQYHIGMVHQHFKLINVFNGIDNILLGTKDDKFRACDEFKAMRACKKDENKNLKTNGEKFKNSMSYVPMYFKAMGKKIASGLGVLNKSRGKKVIKIAKDNGFHVDLTKLVSEMSVSEKQSVEIIKTLYRGVDILILDEPTAVLTPQEIEIFFKTLKHMKTQGKSIILITHKLNEVKAVSDRVLIMRKGKYIKTVETAKASEKELTDLMVGAKTSLHIERKRMENVAPRLYVKNISYTDEEGNKALDNITFTANGGEILGIAGIAGSGQKELLQVLSGLEQGDEGELIYHHPKKNKPVTLFHKSVKVIKEMAKKGAFHYLETGKPVDFKGMPHKKVVQLIDDGHIIFNEDEIINVRGMSPRQLKDYGIRSSYVPEDRLGMGLVGSMDIVDNMMLRNYRKGQFGMLNHAIPTKLSKEVVKQLNVVTPNLKTQVSKLSGGNIQKLLVGREISSSPYVLTAAYPVRGLDINSSYTIYDLLNKQKEKGCAIIFVGEDIDVMLELCDRIIVMNNGKITGELDGRKATKHQVGQLMTAGGAR